MNQLPNFSQLLLQRLEIYIVEVAQAQRKPQPNFDLCHRAASDKKEIAGIPSCFAAYYLRQRSLVLKLRLF